MSTPPINSTTGVLNLIETGVSRLGPDNEKSGGGVELIGEDEMDIVERLRMPTQEFHRLHTDAADEIEKLRKQLYETKDELESCIADLDREVRVGNDLMGETKQLRQQIAELREALRLARKIISDKGDMRCVGNQHIRKRELSVIDEALASTAPAECQHQFVTTFGGNYCIKCNAHAPSNDHPVEKEE